MLKDFVSLIFPKSCINCHKPLTSTENHICTHCKLDLPLTQDHLYQNNDLFRKYAFLSKIKSARAYLFFNQGGITQKLLHELKYNGKQSLGDELARSFSAHLKDLNVDFIIPVPLHRSRLRKRGYNQSVVIAEAMGEEMGVEVRTDILKRVKMTKTQTRKTKIDRWQGLENVYSEASGLVENKSVLVVDDVITTGATVGLLCDRLMEQHVGEIHIAAIARANKKAAKTDSLLNEKYVSSLEVRSCPDHCTSKP